MKIRVSILLLSVFIGRSVFSQDIHFSQFNSSPLNINPALTGLFDGDIRFVGNHRNQWSAITVPYVTSSASLDFNFKPGKRSRDIIATGVLVNSDKAGDGEFGTMQVLGSISYTKEIAGYGEQKLFATYGMQAGVGQRSINYQNLTFDSQYNGDRFDPGAGNGEEFVGNSLTIFDASAGINLFYEHNKKYNLNLGFGMFHLNAPEQSLMSDVSIRLDPRLVLHSNSQVYLSEKVDLMPGFLWMKQGKSNEVNAGLYTRYKFPGARVKTALYLGSYFRLIDRDAFILSARIDYSKLNIGLSYDINFSELSAASNNRGGVELSLIYVLQKTRPSVKRKNVPCPVFM